MFNPIKRLAALALALAATGATAQSYPSRPITLVVPYPPGGLIDMVARIIQPRLQAELGGTIVVENRSGAGGNIGAQSVAKAPADGYTLLLANPSLALSEHIYPKLGYRPLQDITYVGQFGTVPNVLLVNPSLPVKSVPELIEYLRKNPGRLNYASNGFGTSPQMSMELFKGMTNTFIVHIPFRGSAPATMSLLANETQLMFDNLPPVVPQIKSGKMRALAVTRLNAALNKASQDPQVREALVSRGATVIQGSPDDFLKFVRGENTKWGPVVKRAGIVVE